jgi:hypothetical protein
MLYDGKTIVMLSRPFRQSISRSREEILEQLDPLRIHPRTHFDGDGQFEIFFGDEHIAAPLVARGWLQDGVIKGEVSLSGRAWSALIAALLLNVTVLPYFASQSLFWVTLFAVFDAAMWRRYTHYYYQSQDFLSFFQNGSVPGNGATHPEQPHF